MITESLVIDIETTSRVSEQMRSVLERGLKAPANIKDAEKIAAKIEEKRTAIYEKAALSPLTAELAVVGLAWRVEHGTSWEYEVLDAQGGEPTLMQKLDERMARLDPRRIVTFNGRRFDLPFLAARFAIRYMASYPWPTGYDRRHIDVYHLLGEQGSLEQWAVAIGMDAKEIPGSEIPALVAAGEWDTVREHCLHDVRITAELYSRITACASLGER